MGKLKIEVGKSYYTRVGRKVVEIIHRADDSEIFSFLGKHAQNFYEYSADGKISIGPGVDLKSFKDFDLIEEVPSEESITPDEEYIADKRNELFSHMEEVKRLASELGFTALVTLF